MLNLANLSTGWRQMPLMTHGRGYAGLIAHKNRLYIFGTGPGIGMLFFGTKI